MSNITCLERLKMELGKAYYEDTALTIYLDENDLDGAAVYNHHDRKKLYKATRDVLQALLNDIDLYRRIEAQYATKTIAIQHLQNRIDALERRIDAIEDDEEGTDRSNVIFLFHT